MMPTEAQRRVKEAIDEAKYVRVSSNGAKIAVWHGGVQISFYTIPSFSNVGVSSISDEKGEALSQEEMEEHIDEMVEKETFN